MVFRVAILTVSDTAFNKGAEYDLSGPLLVQKVEQHPDYALADSAIVPDEIDAIQEKVKEWVGRKGDEKVDWVITSGGACSLCARGRLP
jgi:gephyrin